ncbi:MAG: FumA C-terminus/TtdB family hydratase beta subunit [Oscillospiraceae bacterium]
MTDKVFEINTKELCCSIPELKVGCRVLLSGTVYTSRDAAHKEIFGLIDKGKELPFPIKGAIIYYAGPTPGKNGMAVGSCGPTTSARMDRFTPRLLDMGLLATIGKGERSKEVIDAIVRNRSVYFCAVGGAGALIAKHIKTAEEIAFPELGCESVKRLIIDKLPLTVAVDSTGADIFTLGREQYKCN